MLTSNTGLSESELQEFFRHSLGGQAIASKVPSGIAWLSDFSKALAYKDYSEKYLLTALGTTATLSVLPLNLASGFAQLIRDILTIDDTDELLANWRPLDHLITIGLFTRRYAVQRAFSSGLVDQIDAWMEKFPSQAPLLYKHWIAGQQGSSRAIEVFGSLGIAQSSSSSNLQETARKEAYKAILRSIVLYELGQGEPVGQVESQWKVSGIEGVEERWRDEYLWLLSGIAKILEVRCFYFHLLEECKASSDRVKRVKQQLTRMRHQTFELKEHLKYCSPLGSLLRSIRRTEKTAKRASVGINTIRRLEESGVRNLQELASFKIQDRPWSRLAG